MKTFFKTTGAVLVAGLALAACGSSSASSTGSGSQPSKAATTTSYHKHCHANHYGWCGSMSIKTHSRSLMLPHVGLATSTITEYASFAANNKFYKQIINPKDWVKSTTFGGYIFVGKYTTTGDGYRQVRNSKIYAMDNNEFLRLVLSKSTKWPRTPVAGFNFVRHGQFGNATVSQVNAAIQWQVQHHFNPVRLDVPHEATIVEAPVGELAPPNSSHRAPGACIPSPAELLGGNGHPATGDPYNALTSNYTIQYSGLNGNLYSHGHSYLTSNCAKALSGVK